MGSDGPDHLSLAQWATYAVIAAVLILINAFFAASETSLLSVRDSRIAQLVEEGNRRARVVQFLRERRQTMLVAIQIVVTLVATLASSLATAVALAALRPWGKTVAVVVATISVLFFLSLLGEITPKNWAVSHAERFALMAAPTVRLSTRILSFLVMLLESLSMAIIRLLPGGRRPSAATYPSGDEIRLIVEESARFGELEQEEKEMIHNVMEIPERTAREIMTPRTRIVAIEASASLADVLKLIVEEGHSRIPVYRGAIDDIVGIIHAKDLLRAVGVERPDASLQDFIIEPHFIPESKRVDKLLQEFRARKSQLAVVLDEYGGTSGLVTMEDVLEEIVGEINDEHDEPESSEIQRLETGEFLVSGGANLEDVGEALDVEFSESEAEGADTIGGLVFGRLGRVPEIGDSVCIAGWLMTVEQVEGRRADRLRLARFDDPAADGEGAAAAAS